MEPTEHRAVRPRGDRGQVAGGVGGRGARSRSRTPSRAPTSEGRSTYVLEMLPYPSGELHMGHVFNYTLGDVFTHIRRRQGYTVLRPMGYDAFGLNSENAAIKEGGHPREITNRNIEAIRRQMKRMGWAIDWSREVSTAEPEYYRWTQWLFLRFFERGLCVPPRGAGQVVPEGPDRAGERAGDRRALRALRHRGRVQEPHPVVLQDHRVRRPAARRDGRARVVARARPDDAAQLDRPLRGRPRDLHGRRERGGAARLHDAARHAVRRDVLRPRPGASADRAADRRAPSTSGPSPTTSGTRPRARPSSARRRRRTASSPAATRSTR